MKILKFAFIILLLSACPADGASIKLEGISGDIVLINGEVLKVGDSIEGVKITGINDSKVTFEDDDGKIFTKELKITFWDQTVQSIKVFFDKQRRRAKQTAKQSSSKDEEDGFFQGFMKNFESDERSTKDLSISEKMKFADADLKAFKEDADTLISKLEKGNPSTRDIQKVMKKFNSLFKKDTKKFNDLKFPCPFSVAGDPNFSLYISWSKGFKTRRQKVSDDLNQRLQKIFLNKGMQVKK